MEQGEKPSRLENKDPRLKPVFLYDRGQRTFKQIENTSGPVSLPKIPETSEKPTVLKVRGSEHTYYELFKTEGALSARTIEGRFKQETGLDPNKAILVTDVPSSEVDIYKYNIISAEAIMRDYKKLLSEKKDIARRIT